MALYTNCYNNTIRISHLMENLVENKINFFLFRLLKETTLIRKKSIKTILSREILSHVCPCLWLRHFHSYIHVTLLYILTFDQAATSLWYKYQFECRDIPQSPPPTLIRWVNYGQLWSTKVYILAPAAPRLRQWRRRRRVAETHRHRHQYCSTTIACTSAKGINRPNSVNVLKVEKRRNPAFITAVGQFKCGRAFSFRTHNITSVVGQRGEWLLLMLIMDKPASA